ncbi:MAG TPA: hypothetical protein VHC22_05480 [Pirellulales bacterium]|nr:hypothetical protein [Pirellulales bacterium]
MKSPFDVGVKTAYPSTGVVAMLIFRISTGFRKVSEDVVTGCRTASLSILTALAADGKQRVRR